MGGSCSIVSGWACPQTGGACHLACSDGVVLTANGEVCDDGNSVGGDGCGTNPLGACPVETGWTCTGQPSTCTPICGDGLRRGPEQCDNGGANSDSAPDACRTNCRVAFCGDGVEDAAEVCDDGPQNGRPGMCNALCTDVTPWASTGETPQALTMSPGGIGVFLSRSFLESVCSLNEIDYADLTAKDAWLQGKGFIGGRVTTLTADYLADNPFMLYDDGIDPFDGGGLFSIETPLYEMEVGKFLIPSGTPVLLAVFGGPLTGTCCGGSAARHDVICGTNGGDAPEPTCFDGGCPEPDFDQANSISIGQNWPVGRPNPPSAPAATATARASCDNKCSIAGGIGICPAPGEPGQSDPPETFGRTCMPSASPGIDRLCQHVTNLHACPGMCEGPLDDVINTGGAPTGAPCGFLIGGDPNTLAADLGCMLEQSSGPDNNSCYAGGDPYDGDIEELSTLSALEAWNVCVRTGGTPEGCQRHRLHGGGGLREAASTSLLMCGAESGNVQHCVACAVQGMGGGCTPALDLPSGDIDAALHVRDDPCTSPTTDSAADASSAAA